MIHRIKTLTEYFEQSKLGNKNFEIRKNDRDYKIGDLLVLCEFDGKKTTGRTLTCIITYITEFGCIDGYIAIGVSFGRIN